MKYKCKKAAPGLTLGKEYMEHFKYPNPFNACVWNDNRQPEHFPRKEFFKVIED
jgi:hypothetical protein